MRRSPIRKRRPGPPRRGRIVDKDYLAWLHTQPGQPHGGRTATVHHVRSFGSPKNDRRALPMEFGYHTIQEGPRSIEALGQRVWQLTHKVDIERAILAYQDLYLQEHPDVVW